MLFSYWIQAAIVQHFAQDYSSGPQWCTVLFPTERDGVPEGLVVRKTISYIDHQLLDLPFTFCVCQFAECVFVLVKSVATSVRAMYPPMLLVKARQNTLGLRTETPTILRPGRRVHGGDGESKCAAHVCIALFSLI